MAETGKILALCKSSGHSFSKKRVKRLHLIAGQGVRGDAHCGQTVMHRSRVAADPAQPNLRQVHLVHSELLEELAEKGFNIKAGDIGENILTRGIDLLALPCGTHLHIGAQVFLRVTGLRNPCKQLDHFRPGLMKAVLDRASNGDLIRKAGIMAVVEQGGYITADDKISIELPEKPYLPLTPV